MEAILTPCLYIKFCSNHSLGKSFSMCRMKCFQMSLNFVRSQGPISTYQSREMARVLSTSICKHLIFIMKFEVLVERWTWERRLCSFLFTSNCAEREKAIPIHPKAKKGDSERHFSVTFLGGLGPYLNICRVSKNWELYFFLRAWNTCDKESIQRL